MGLQKDVKKFIKELEREGWRVEQGRVHYKAYHPKGGFISISGTSSDGNAVKHMRKDAQRLREANKCSTIKTV